MPKYHKQATCHPDRPHKAKGLCLVCYKKAQYQSIAPEKKRETVEKRRTKYRQKLLSWYGMTEEEYNNLLAEQGGVCALCKRPPVKYSLNVDHEHQPKEKSKTPESRRKKVRGLLCHRCNRALGLFGNDLETLNIIAHNFPIYIEKYSKKSNE